MYVFVPNTNQYRHTTNVKIDLLTQILNVMNTLHLNGVTIRKTKTGESYNIYLQKLVKILWKTIPNILYTSWPYIQLHLLASCKKKWKEKSES